MRGKAPTEKRQKKSEKREKTPKRAAKEDTAQKKKPKVAKKRMLPCESGFNDSPDKQRAKGDGKNP